MIEKFSRFFNNCYLSLSDSIFGITPYIGYPHNGNIGDETLYRLAISNLNKARLISDLSSRGRLLNISLHFSNNHYLIGGGSLLFGDEFFKKLFKLESIGLTPVLWGTGSRELPKDIESQKKWSILLQHSQGAVRGFETAKSLEKIGVKNEVIGDMGFLLSLNYPEIFVSTGKVVLIPRLIDKSHPDLFEMDIMRLELLKKLILKLYSNGIKMVIYLPCKDDYRNLKDWILDIDQYQIPIFFYNNDDQEFFDLVKDANVIISMRMHPGIFGYSLGVPTIFLESRPKYYDVISVLDQKPKIVDVTNISSTELFELAVNYFQLSNHSRICQKTNAINIATKQLDFSRKIETILVKKT